MVDSVSLLENKFEEYNTNKLNLHLFICIVIYILITCAQMLMPMTHREWQGVLGQAQVMLSVYVVVKIGSKGFLTAIALNVALSFITLLRLVRTNNYNILPGVVIPICTIMIVTIIMVYNRKFKEKSNEVLLQKVQRGKELVELQEVSIMAMAALAETRDNETGKHIQRTKLYVKVLCEALYNNGDYKNILNPQMIELIVSSAPLHDIGKVGIPDSILLKPGKLTDEEFEVIKKHTILGYEAIIRAEELMGRDESFLKNASEIVLYHHERWDGKGYMYNLKGEEIPLSARIMSVADVYDALTSERVYKKIQSHQEAFEIICEGSGTQFDPKVVEAFVIMARRFQKIAERYKEDLDKL